MDAPKTDNSWTLHLLAWLIALAATLGALFVGEVMGQKPCLLCWFQRAFMFPLAIVLAVGVFHADRAVVRYALPLAIGGALVALYHALLYAGILTEALRPCTRELSCTDAAMTVMGLPLPYLSLAAFIAIIGLLAVSNWGKA